MRAVGLSDRFVADPPPPLLSDGLLEPLIVADLHSDRRAAPYRALLTREGKGAWIEVPLTVGKSALGVMIFYYPTSRAFHDEEVEIMRAFANQAAQAIKNARLYSTADAALARRAEQMQVILNAMTEAILLIDRDGQIALVNPAIKLIGLRSQELLGADLDTLPERPHLDLAERLGFESDQTLRSLVKELRAPAAWVDVPGGLIHSHRRAADGVCLP